MLDIKAIKSEIDNENIKNTFIIFKYSDTDFIAFQYFNAICKILGAECNYIDNLSELNVKHSNLFAEPTETVINLYKTDKFETTDENLMQKNLIIICKSVEKKTTGMYNDYVVEIPKLEEWQIQDYVYSLAAGVDEKELDKLLSVCKNDIYRIDAELNKLLLFKEVERKHVYQQFIEDGIFSDLSFYSIFDFSNAIIKKDINSLKNIYRELEKIDVESMGLLTVLLNNFRNIIKIQLANNPTAESCDMKSGQFWAIKHQCGIYTKEQLLKIFDFLTNIDKQIKTGNMPVNSFLIDYVVITILTMR